jgi:hypothetical protein
MTYRLFADLIVVAHVAFVLFVLFGGLLALRWRGMALIHIPCAVWGVLIEARGWICPLTPLENHLRRLAGEAGYSGGFIEHYVMPLLYPAGLNRTIQWIMALTVIVLNLAVYALVWSRWRRTRGTGD